MAVIHKFILDPRDEQQVNMQDGAVILSAAVQQGNICIWAKIPSNNPGVQMARLIKDYESPIRARTILMYGTGYPLPDHDNFHFIGTVILQSGELVLHIFEAK